MNVLWIVKPLPIMLGNATGKPVRLSYACTQHSAQGQGHSMKLRWQSQRFLKIVEVQQTNIGYFYECMIIIGRVVM
jgi:hypothetical protein